MATIDACLARADEADAKIARWAGASHADAHADCAVAAVAVSAAASVFAPSPPPPTHATAL